MDFKFKATLTNQKNKSLFDVKGSKRKSSGRHSCTKFYFFFCLFFLLDREDEDKNEFTTEPKREKKELSNTDVGLLCNGQ